jgi:hypothetical protein
MSKLLSPDKRVESANENNRLEIINEEILNVTQRNNHENEL